MARLRRVPDHGAQHGDALPVNHRAIQGISLGGLPAWPENFRGNHPYADQVNAGGSLRQWIRSDGSFDTLDDWNTVELIARGSSAAHIVGSSRRSMDCSSRTRPIAPSTSRSVAGVSCFRLNAPRSPSGTLNPQPLVRGFRSKSAWVWIRHPAIRLTELGTD